MKISSRHHYIPQFYIKGFTNDVGITYVYDKKNDKIWERQIRPKGIFYDWDRNTIYNENDSTSIIEDFWFKTIDNECSDLIEKYRESENTESIHNIDNASKMQFFLIHLLWRLPKFDFAFDYLFENAKKTDSNGEVIKFDSDYKKDGFKKLERLLLPNKIIKQITSRKISGGYYSKLFEKSGDVFLLGDYPMLYRFEPNSFEDIIIKEVLLPISSKRLYFLSRKSELYFDFSRVSTLNTLIIQQSIRFVCSPDKEFLEKSVEYYKKQIEFLPLDFLKEGLFE